MLLAQQPERAVLLLQLRPHPSDGSGISMFPLLPSIGVEASF
jgi:hypothetical protein